MLAAAFEIVGLRNARLLGQPDLVRALGVGLEPCDQMTEILPFCVKESVAQTFRTRGFCSAIAALCSEMHAWCRRGASRAEEEEEDIIQNIAQEVSDQLLKKKFDFANK